MKRIDWETYFLYDRGSLVNDEVFGDIPTFDTTYQTNAYSKPFVVIVGINQHIEPISFLFGLQHQKQNTPILICWRHF